MEEMRFSPPVQEIKEESKEVKKERFKIQMPKKLLKPLIFILIAIVLIIGGFWAKSVVSKMWGGGEDGSGYSAIFLTNGQVYFGKLQGKNSEEFVLNDVYYLQMAGEGEAKSELSGAKFSIIKLGQELHGPTDELFINSSHILFYENLREDSKVVQSIKTQKQ